MSAALLDGVLACSTAVETALRWLLLQLGAVDELAGQPLWPFAHRLAVPMLSLDAGLTRQFAACVLALALAGLLLGAALWLRGRARALCAGLALGAAAIGLADWPAAALLWMPAVPTSLHRLPPGAQDEAALQAPPLYQRHCQACHGAQGEGDGPLAGQGSRFPPTLNRSLLWRRTEGELYWLLRHGQAGAQGRHDRPALPADVADDHVWQLVAYLQWQAAGRQLSQAGEWQLPVAAPALAVQCPGQPTRPLAALRGQRLRIVALAPGQPPLAEDPRFQTVSLSTAPVAGGGCQAVSAASWQAYALVAGVPPAALAGTELLVDRAGWLRARRRPADPPWSEALLVCRSPLGPVATARPAKPAQDPLDRLLARLDAEPLRAVRGGRLH